MKIIKALALLVLINSAAVAAPFDVDDIVDSKEPLAAAIKKWSFERCTLTAGTSRQRVGKEKEPGNFSAGNVFVPIKAGAAAAVSIDLNREFCAVKKLFVPELEEADITDHFGIKFKVGAELQIKLKAGTLFNLLDVNLADIDEVGVGADAAIISMPSGRRTEAGIHLLKDSPGSCEADQPPHINSARMIVTNCVGKLRATLKSKKNLTISVLDVKFGEIFSGLAPIEAGLTAKWTREIEGGIKACDAKPAAGAAAKPKPEEAAKPSADKKPNTDANVTIPLGGGKEARFEITGKNEVKISYGDKPESAALSGTKSKDGKAGEKVDADPKDKAASAAKSENVDITKDCTDSVVYSTDGLVLFGAGWVPAKDILLKAQKYIQPKQ